MPTKGKKCRCSAPISEATGRCIFGCPEKPLGRLPSSVGVKVIPDRLLSPEAVSKAFAEIDPIYKRNRLAAQARHPSRRAS